MNDRKLNTKKTAVSLVLVLLGLMGVGHAAWAATTFENIKQRGFINLGVRNDSIPFSFVDKGKQYHGFTVDLCRRIVDEYKKINKLPSLDVHYVAVTSKDRIPKLNAGEIDLECGSTSNFAERRKEAGFSIPIFVTGMRLLAYKENANITKLVQLEGRTVSVTAGSGYEKFIRHYVEAKKAKINVVNGKNDEESVKLMLDKKADFYLNDDVRLSSFKETSELSDKLALNPNLITVEPIGIMIRKDDVETKKIVDKVLSDMMHSGEYERLYNTWFTKSIAQLNINFHLPINTIMRAYIEMPTDYITDLTLY